MDSIVVGSRGTTYNLLPHERLIASSFEKKFEKVHTKTGVLRRNGSASAALRAAVTANAMIVGLSSIALLVATSMVAKDHPVSPSRYIINIVIYTVVAGPFLYLQWRRRIQSGREARAYRDGVSPSFTEE